MNRKNKRRLYKKILELLRLNNCLFITFTFSDESIKNIDEKNRLRYIKRFLNEQTSAYILNKDYGRKHGREHYHVIAKAIYKDKIFLPPYKLGNITAEKIKRFDKYTKKERTLEDIAKDLTEHATKESTHESKIIYSRPKKINRDFKYKNQIDQIELNSKIKRQAKERQNITKQLIKKYGDELEDIEESQSLFIDDLLDL